MFKSCPRNHMKNGRTSGFTVFSFFVVTSQFFIQFLFSRYFRGGKANDGIHCVCCLYPPIIDKMGIVTVKGCRVITNKVRHGNFINPVMQQQRNNRMPEFTSCRSKRKP